MQKTDNPKPARLLISEQTQRLLIDIFGAPRLFEGATQIRRRIVSWGNKPTVEFAHRGIVVAEQDLLNHLWRKTETEFPRLSHGLSADAAWTIISKANCEILSAAQSFGARVASTIPVTLNANVTEHCCWVESVAEGWLFLLPAGCRKATLISCGYVPHSLLEQSYLVAAQIAHFESEPGAHKIFPAFPRILSSIYGVDWLACGSAAMNFDPLCGEGAGHAARAAFLASAVIGATADNYRPGDLLAHYSTRLMRGFLRHLELSLSFYRSGGSDGFWAGEAESLQRGIAWMHERLSRQAPSNYRFAGYDLRPIAEAAR